MQKSGDTDFIFYRVVAERSKAKVSRQNFEEVDNPLHKFESCPLVKISKSNYNLTKETKMPEEKEEIKVIGYRPLSDNQKHLMNEAKILGNQIGEFIDEISMTVDIDDHPIADGRCLAVARTEMQTAMMWLNRAIAQPETFC